MKSSLRSVAVFCILALAVCGADKKRPKAKADKPPDLVVVTLKVQREAGNFAVEGTVRNNSDKPMKGLVLFFEFMEPGGRTISRMNTTVSEVTLEPGEEGEFLTQTPDQVRAVHVKLDAEDKDGRYFTIDKPGPYAIQ
ncbi:MAG: FxLYD domain-containing protein [Bryobacteraceae bacterium]